MMRYYALLLIFRSPLRGSWHLSRPSGSPRRAHRLPRLRRARPSTALDERRPTKVLPNGPAIRARLMGYCNVALEADLAQTRRPLPRVARGARGRYPELAGERGFGPAREHVVALRLDAVQYRRVELPRHHYRVAAPAWDVTHPLVRDLVQPPRARDLEAHQRDETLVHDPAPYLLFRVPEALQVLLRKVHPAPSPVFADVAQEVRQLHRGAQRLGVRVGPPVGDTQDAAHHDPDDGGAPVDVLLQVRVGLVAEHARVHLHALHERADEARLYAARGRGVGERAQDGVRDRRPGHRRERLRFQSFEGGELFGEVKVAWVVYDFVGVAHEGVERVDAWPYRAREQTGREVVGSAVRLLDAAAQLVTAREIQSVAERGAVYGGIQPHYAVTPTLAALPSKSRPTRSAASFAPMVTRGTPVPGRVLAPTK